MTKHLPTVGACPRPGWFCEETHHFLGKNRCLGPWNPSFTTRVYRHAACDPTFAALKNVRGCLLSAEIENEIVGSNPISAALFVGGNFFFFLRKILGKKLPQRKLSRNAVRDVLCTYV